MAQSGVSRFLTRQEVIESLHEQSLFTALHVFLCEHIGLLHESVDMTDKWMVLDVACGLGYWVRDMAEQYFNRTVIGIEKQDEVVNAARWLIPSKSANNAQFQAADMHDLKMCIGKDFFDLIHARFLAPVVAPLAWQALLQELFRVCRPGGVMVLVESSLQTNSCALSTCYECLHCAMGGKTGYTLDITPMLHVLIADVGCHNVHKAVTEFSFSFGTPLHTCLIDNLVSTLRIVQEFLSERCIADLREIDQICRDLIIDLNTETFTATWTIVTVTGEKPIPEQKVDVLR